MNQDAYHNVQTRYGNIAKGTSNPATQQDADDKIAQAFGYSADDLSSLPGKANLGVSCGNPTAFASIKPVCLLLPKLLLLHCVDCNREKLSSIWAVVAVLMCCWLLARSVKGGGLLGLI
jgi:hypothetical protein